jgi:hypothetical protein
MSKAPDLPEALAWLDFCLGETSVAMTMVKEAYLEAMKSKRTAGGTPAPPVLGQVYPYHAMCEAAAGLITLRGRAAKWGRDES